MQIRWEFYLDRPAWPTQMALPFSGGAAYNFPDENSQDQQIDV
jgi:hypothetical protein